MPAQLQILSESSSLVISNNLKKTFFSTLLSIKASHKHSVRCTRGLRFNMLGDLRWVFFFGSTTCLSYCNLPVCSTHSSEYISRLAKTTVLSQSLFSCKAEWGETELPETISGRSWTTSLEILNKVQQFGDVATVTQILYKLAEIFWLAHSWCFSLENWPSAQAMVRWWKVSAPKWKSFKVCYD